MNFLEIKKLMNNSLGANPGGSARELEEAGVIYDFSQGFTGRVIDRIFSRDVRVAKQIEFSKYLNLAFSRIAVTGIAAIVLLLISIFLMEGDLSFNSLLGISDSQTESIVCLLSGN
jgi:hypothetical protein